MHTLLDIIENSHSKISYIREALARLFHDSNAFSRRMEEIDTYVINTFGAMIDSSDAIDNDDNSNAMAHLFPLEDQVTLCCIYHIVF